MREIVLDTETTGLDPLTGDRIVEIGAVELVNGIPTGASFHAYLNPERAMPEAAQRIHGLSDAFLRDKPLFRDVADEFCRFCAGARLVIHNAAFDVAFLNAEFERCGLPPVAAHLVVDTLAIARRKHGGASNSLDALCARYGVDNTRRTTHGALLDAELLAEVYLELMGGRQAALSLTVSGFSGGEGETSGMRPARPRPEPLPPRLGADERAAHAAFVATLGPDALWRRYEVAARDAADAQPAVAGDRPQPVVG